MKRKYRITVFTPTYNRSHTLPRLYASLVNQRGDVDFEWLIIDDGSTDGTDELVYRWIDEDKVDILYKRVANGGKPRAINRAVTLARSPFLFIVDSDDYLADDALEFMCSRCEAVAGDDDIAGVGVMRINQQVSKKPNFTGHVDATNLERGRYNLDVDCNEAYKTDVLRRFPFEVWPGEIFTPEEVVLNEMALNGYKIRWYDKGLVYSAYRQDGMTLGGWKLMKNNPMGFAMLYNHKLKYHKRLKDRVNDAIQLTAHSIIASHYGYVLKSNAPLLGLVLYPAGMLLAQRRKHQYKTKAK